MDSEDLNDILNPAMAAEEAPAAAAEPAAEAEPEAAPPEVAEPALADPPAPDPLDARLEAFGERLIARWEQSRALARVEASEAAAKARHADFDEKAAAFAQAAGRDPALIRDMAAAEDPGEYAYARGRDALELAGAGGLDALKARLRAEWEAEAGARLPRPAAPATTATERSVGARRGPDWGGPRTIGDLLPPLG